MGFQLWDRIAAFFRRENLYRQDNLFTDQTQLTRIISGGELLDFSKQHAILEQTNLQINRLERYKDYDQMSEVPEVNLGLDMYADESTVTDSERKHTVMVRANSRAIRDAVQDFLYNTLAIDSLARPAIRYLCKYGDAPFEIVPTKDRDAVASLKHMNIYNFTRVEIKHGDLVGYFFQDELASEPTFLHPWSVVHMRLTSFENIYAPYGCAVLDSGRKAFKQLRLMEDAALIYRITRSSERRIFKIPIGNIASKEVPGYLESIAQKFKKRRIINPATNEIDERWAPLIQEDDYWLPVRPDGVGPEVTTLAGGQNLDQIADIVYFKKKLVTSMKIPFSKVGLSDGADENAMKRASHISPEFATAVQWIQREFLTGLKKTVMVHLVLKGYKADAVKGFDLYMTASSAIDELYRIETWKSRSSVIGELKDTGLFPDRWIIMNFTDLTEDEAEDLALERTDAGADAGAGAGAGAGAASLEDEFPLEGGPAPEATPGPAGPAGPASPAAGPGAGPAPAGAAEVPESLHAGDERMLLEAKRRLKAGQARLTQPLLFESGFAKMASDGEFDGMPIGERSVRTRLTEAMITEAKAAALVKDQVPSPAVQGPTAADIPPSA